ncbi:MAG: hypothetical protein WCM76_03395 [Bacteroidota bacterium]
MKPIIVFILLLGWLQTSYCQSNAKNYYTNINKAELAICRGRLKAASKFYRKAFQCNESPYTIDLLNALRCEFYGEASPERLIQYTVLLSEMGSRINNCIDSADYNSTYKSLLSIQDTVKPKYNQTLAHKLDSLLNQDQIPRRAGCWTYQDSCVKKVIYSDSSNMQAICNLFKLYGTINEQSASVHGIFDLNIIIHHNLQWRIYPMQEILKKEVLAGNFDARSFANIEDGNYMHQHFNDTTINTHRIYGSDSYYTIANVLIIFKAPKEQKQLEKKRKELFLESMDELAEKTIFQFNNNNKYFFNSYVNSLVLGNDEQNKAYAKEIMDLFDSKKVKGKYYIKKDASDTK